MFIYEPMSPVDIFSMDIANLDSKSENFTLDYYLYYMAHHPFEFVSLRQFSTAGRCQPLMENPVIGYIFGKLEVKEKLCMHVSALSIGPAFRTAGLGTALLLLLELNGNNLSACFSDLYVRDSNYVAANFYKKNGYSVYRKVLGYYGGPIEDAYDMRKPLLADPEGECLKNGQDIYSTDL